MQFQGTTYLSVSGLVKDFFWVVEEFVCFGNSPEACILGILVS